MKAPLGAMALAMLTHAAGAQMIGATVYSVRGSMTPRTNGQMPEAMAMKSASWTGTTVVAGGRVRTEYVRVVGDSSVLTSDYTLSDSAGSVVVDPKAKTFYVVPKLQMPDLDSVMKPAGMHFTVKLLKASLDSVGTERIAGRMTQHYRMTIVQTMSLETEAPEIDPDALAGIGNKVTMTTEFWMADLPAMPNNAMVTDVTAQIPKLGPAAALVQAMDSLRRKLPKGRLSVRTVSTTQAGAGDMSITFEASDDITDIKSQQVDAKTLAVPDDYAEGSPPDRGMRGALPSAPAGAGDRWRASAWAKQLKARRP
ncbi:MAG TPA: hypothetical protein VF483_02380 [Gemmatimonadaceae bacterium]